MVLCAFTRTAEALTVIAGKKQGRDDSVSSENGSVVTVKNWHVFLTIASWLVIVAMAFASLRAQNDENERRIRDLELRPAVTQQQYEDGQHVLEQRLDRIERKIDGH
jgi:hypothetical protein